MQRVISSMMECSLFINTAFILASHLKSIAELQFLIKDFMRTLKIFIVLVFPFQNVGIPCAGSWAVLSVLVFAIIFFLFNIYDELAHPKTLKDTNPFD